MIDIHTHILPGVDDGSPDIPTSIKMLKAEKEQGVDTVILTPHYIHGKTSGEKIRTRFEQFKNNKEVKRLEIDLVLGNEIYYSPGIIDDLDNGDALAIKGNVLLEFAPGETIEKIISGCRKIYNDGYGVILAHIERYEHLNKYNIDELFNMYVQLQMNASYVNYLCSTICIKKKRWYKQLLKDGSISYIASDAHDTKTRSPELYIDQIRKNFPEHAERILTGEDLY